MPAQVPTGEKRRSQQRFSVPRRHEEHQPIDLSPLDRLQLLNQQPMMPSDLEPSPDQGRERRQMLARQPYRPRRRPPPLITRHPALPYLSPIPPSSSFYEP